MLRCCALIAALILVGLATVQARADRRVALVIGNSQYREIPALIRVLVFRISVAM